MATGARSDAAPARPRGIVEIGKATARRFLEDQMMDRAAALTYYSMMSLFPAMFVVVSLLGLLGTQELVTQAVDYAREQGADATLANALGDSLNGIVSRASGQVGAALVVAVVIALYGASGAFGAAGRALNVVLRIESDDSFVRQKAKNLMWTLVIVVLAIVTLVAVFLGGGLANDVFGWLGVGDELARAWSYLRWAIAPLAAFTIYAIVFSFAPDVHPRRLRWITPGAALGVGAWIVATAGFSVYVRNFAAYGATYGAFAAAVILLLWLWITNLCLLAGAELNAVLAGDERADG
jgi:membrane protein